MFKKVLVANRGEIACRIMRACREVGVKSVAVYSQADKDSLHVRLADEAICIGAGGNSDSYLNLANVLMAAQISSADAVHPGYGYFSERSTFVEALKSIGVAFIGPTSEAMEAMGDKSKAKRAAIKAGCPVVPGSEEPIANEVEAEKFATKLGYPILLKAVAGGGGRGIRRVDAPEFLPNSWRTAQAEAQASFGNGQIMVEKCFIDPRHIEFQVLADQHGNAVYLGDRECSIQNLRHQKLIEEAPSSDLPDRIRKKMGVAAVRVAKAVGYQNAGTVEFLVDADHQFYFLEMNTRLQVEHPVTELTTGIDIVHQMLHITAGEPLPWKQREIICHGHAIEARITAQDPEQDFAPSTGLITRWNAPGGNGVRIDTHCYAGFSVSPFYDPMIAKLIVFAPDRVQAVIKLQTALREFEIEGITTNIPFLRKLTAHPMFISGQVNTGFVPRFLAESG